MEDTVRRNRLHELDSILDALERLNLRDATELPPTLRQSLQDLGLEVPASANVTELIERVWELQEQFLGPAQGTESPAGRVNPA